MQIMHKTRLLILILLFTNLIFMVCCHQTQSDGTLTPEKVATMLSQNELQLVDLRTAQEFTAEHISGALWINGSRNDLNDVEKKLLKNKAVCLYGPEDNTRKMAIALKDKGFQQVFILPVRLTDGKATANSLSISPSLSLTGYREKISSGIDLVYIYADWCAVCKKVSPIIQNVVDSYQAENIQLHRIGFDEHPTLMDSLLIREIPLILLYKNGKEIARSQGLTKAVFWKKKINAIL